MEQVPCKVCRCYLAAQNSEEALIEKHDEMQWQYGADAVRTSAGWSRTADSQIGAGLAASPVASWMWWGRQLSCFHPVNSCCSGSACVSAFHNCKQVSPNIFEHTVNDSGIRLVLRCRCKSFPEDRFKTNSDNSYHMQHVLNSTICVYSTDFLQELLAVQPNIIHPYILNHLLSPVQWTTPGGI